jgi:hypothetical protein
MFKIALSFYIIGASYLFGDLFEDIEKLNKGIDGYILGKNLNIIQTELFKKNSVQSDNPNVVKFLDGENLLIALNKTNLKVIAINKRFNQIDSNITKNLISKLIYEHSDPTVEVHEKIIYWIFDKNGNILNEIDIKEWKDSLKANNQQTLVDAVKGVEIKNSKTDFNPYLTVKLTSDQILIKNKFDLNTTSESNLSNIYILISSSQLINETVKK